jgi:glucokinase
MHVKSEPSIPRPFATLFEAADAAVQSSPTLALFAGFTAACAGSVVLAMTATAVAAIAKRIKEVFLIDEFSIFFCPRG